MHIVFTAYKDKNKVSAPTAKEAAKEFLARFNNRTFDIAEYRNGSHILAFQIGGTYSPKDDYFRISFKSRKEAQAFIDAA